MRKNLNLLLAFAVCALCVPGAQAGTPESAAFIDRGRSLFDFGRWTDARHEFLQARETLSPADREAAVFADGELLAFPAPVRRVYVRRGDAPTVLLRHRCESFYEHAAKVFF